MIIESKQTHKVICAKCKRACELPAVVGLTIVVRYTCQACFRVNELFSGPPIVKIDGKIIHPMGEENVSFTIEKKRNE